MADAQSVADKSLVINHLATDVRSLGK
jgi:hypothetical protein